MVRDTLTFVHSPQPPTSELSVYESATRSFLGTAFTFRIIGSSHYVSAPAYDFHELSSCTPVATEGTTLGLDDDWDARTLSYETDRLRCETTVERQPLSAFPRDREFDLAHWFEADAVTTIELGPAGFETYHTYPEFDLALYTQTVFQTLPDHTSSVASNHGESLQHDSTPASHQSTD